MSPLFKVVTAALLAVITCSPDCLAQQGQPQANKFRNRTKPAQVLQQASARATYGRMNQPPELPNLPAFTSGKFVFARQGDVGRTNQKAVHLEYAINDAPPSVIAWYENVLRQYGWKITQKTDYSIYGTRVKDGNAVSVFVDNNNAVGFRYRLNVAYKFFKPVEDEPAPRQTSQQTSNTGTTTQSR